MSDRPEDDLLSSVLNAYQMHAGVYGNPSLCGAWQFGMSGHKRASFHIVGSGNCWLHTRLSPVPEPMREGDLVVFPRDAWHLLSGQRELIDEENHMQMDGSDDFTTLVCGFFEFRVGGENPILEAMPEVIVIRRENAGLHLETLGRVLLEEAKNDDLGTRTVLNKIADTLFVMIVRYYVNHIGDQKGLLAALSDSRLRKALSAIHRDDATHWTLDTLAQEAGMSRASFAQQFAEMVGTTPIEYLTRWRMTQAELLLRDPNISVATAAERAGYGTEAAFRKAFKRIHGIGPGAVRRWFRTRFGDDNDPRSITDKSK